MRQVVAAGLVALAVACATGAATALAGTARTSSADFSLNPSKTEIANPNAPELTIDASGGTATDNHCCDGGKWTTTYTWHVPQTLTTGKSVTVTVGMSVSNVQPEQPILFQMTVLAPDFAQSFQVHYPNPPAGSQTFTIPISAGNVSAPELTITVGVVSARVVYHYVRTTGTGGRATVLIAAHQSSNDLGDHTLAVFGHFSAARKLSDCQSTSCSLRLAPVGANYGTQTFDEWQHTKNLRVRFKILSGRVDRGPKGLAIDLVATAVSVTGVPAAPSSCHAGSQVSVHASATMASFGCGAITVGYQRKFAYRIVGSAITG